MKNRYRFSVGAVFVWSALIYTIGTSEVFAKTEASSEISTQSYYNEAAYDWPGRKQGNKQKVQSVVSKPGKAISPIMPFGDCVFIDNSSENKEIKIDFSTVDQWKNFKNDHPDFITVTMGCERQAISALCVDTKKILMADRIGAVRTIKTDDGVRLFQCMESTDATGKLVRGWIEIGNRLLGRGCPTQSNKSP